MKRSHFGGMLFLTGSLGYLIFSLYLSQNQYAYNGMTGTLAALLGNELLIPYLVFCAMGVIGFILTLEHQAGEKKAPSSGVWDSAGGKVLLAGRDILKVYG